MITYCSAQSPPKIIIIRVISFISKGMLVKLPLFRYKKRQLKFTKWPLGSLLWPFANIKESIFIVWAKLIRNRALKWPTPNHRCFTDTVLRTHFLNPDLIIFKRPLSLGSDEDTENTRYTYLIDQKIVIIFFLKNIFSYILTRNYSIKYIFF